VCIILLFVRRVFVGRNRLFGLLRRHELLANPALAREVRRFPRADAGQGRLAIIRCE